MKDNQYDFIYACFEKTLFIQQVFTKSARSFGFSLAEMRILLILYETGEMRQIDVSKELVMDKSTVSRSVNNLIEQRAISSLKSSCDKRANIVTLTAFGAESLARHNERRAVPLEWQYSRGRLQREKCTRSGNEGLRGSLEAQSPLRLGFSLAKTRCITIDDLLHCLQSSFRCACREPGNIPRYAARRLLYRLRYSSSLTAAFWKTALSLWLPSISIKIELSALHKRLRIEL